VIETFADLYVGLLAMAAFVLALCLDRDEAVA
jgi:hypothetical protein